MAPESTGSSVRGDILLVEDRDSLRQMLRLALEVAGHRVLEASDEPEAVRLLQRNRPALVLTDLKLPRGDGFGVLQRRQGLRSADAGRPPDGLRGGP